jgi:1-acyl-sn-glycerol-3-phosphate acyltransferase
MFLSRAFDDALTLLGRFLFCVFNILFLLFVTASLPFLRKADVRRLSPVWGRVSLFFLRVKVIVENRERLFMPSGESCEYAVMHTSTLDSFLYPAIIPWNTVYVVKSQLRRHLLLGLPFRRCGFIFVSRDRSGKGLEKFSDEVSKIPSGVSLFLHPEGTRIPNGLPRKARQGFAIAAHARKFRIVPITTQGGSALWARGAMFPKPGTVHVFVHEHWSDTEVLGASPAQLCSRYDTLCAEFDSQTR